MRSRELTNSDLLLNGSRFIAALAVYFSHNLPIGSNEKIVNLAMSGYVGVTYFFILSGYVMAKRYWFEMTTISAKNISNFYRLRFWRIYPTYIVVLIATFIFSNEKNTLNLFFHILCLQPWIGDIERVYVFNPPGWSIGVEVFFYLLFPFLFPILRSVLNSMRKVVLFGLVIISLIFSNQYLLSQLCKTRVPSESYDLCHHIIYRFPISRLGDFLIGVTVYAALYMRKSEPKKFVPPILTFGSFSLVLFTMASPTTVNSTISFDFLFVIPFATLIYSIAAKVESENPRSYFRAFSNLGDFSYSFYLIHGVGGAFLNHKLSILDYYPRQIIVVLILIILSALIYHLFEKPIRGTMVNRALNQTK